MVSGVSLYSDYLSFNPAEVSSSYSVKDWALLTFSHTQVIFGKIFIAMACLCVGHVCALRVGWLCLGE